MHKLNGDDVDVRRIQHTHTNTHYHTHIIIITHITSHTQTQHKHAHILNENLNNKSVHAEKQEKNQKNTPQPDAQKKHARIVNVNVKKGAPRIDSCYSVLVAGVYYLFTNQFRKCKRLLSAACGRSATTGARKRTRRPYRYHGEIPEKHSVHNCPNIPRFHMLLATVKFIDMVGMDSRAAREKCLEESLTIVWHGEHMASELGTLASRVIQADAHMIGSWIQAMQKSYLKVCVCVSSLSLSAMFLCVTFMIGIMTFKNVFTISSYIDRSVTYICVPLLIYLYVYMYLRPNRL